MKVSLEYAETHLAQLLSAAVCGEEVQIDCPGKPALKLVPLSSEGVAAATAKRSLLNAAKGQIWLAPDWDSPETNKEIEDLFENSAIVPELRAK